jgi:hypothetical protein
MISRNSGSSGRQIKRLIAIQQNSQIVQSNHTIQDFLEVCGRLDFVPVHDLETLQIPNGLLNHSPKRLDLMTLFHITALSKENLNLTPTKTTKI